MKTTVVCSYSTAQVRREENEWTTILRAPIRLDPGDVIQMDLAVVSTAGGGSDLLEFTDQNNTATMRLCYWIRDTGLFGATGATRTYRRAFVCGTGTTNLQTQTITLTVPPGFYSVTDVQAILTDQMRTASIPGETQPYTTYDNGPIPPLDPNLGAQYAGISSPFALYCSDDTNNNRCLSNDGSGVDFAPNGMWAGCWSPELVWDPERSRFALQNLHTPYIALDTAASEEAVFGQEVVASTRVGPPAVDEPFFSVSGVHILDWGADDPVGAAFWNKLGFLPGQVQTQDAATFTRVPSADRGTDVNQPTSMHFAAYLRDDGNTRTLLYSPYDSFLGSLAGADVIQTGQLGSTSIRAQALPLLSSQPFYIVATDLPISGANSYVSSGGDLLQSLGVVSKAYSSGNFVYEMSQREFAVTESRTLTSIQMQLLNADGTPATNLNLFSTVVVTFQKRAGQS